MNGLALLLGATVIFIAAYIVYGSWLAKKWGVDPSRPTPAYTQKDGIDYLPTKPAVLLVPARLLAQFPLQSSDGFQFLCGLLSEVYSSAVFTTMVQWWHLFAIRAKVLVRSLNLT